MSSDAVQTIREHAACCPELCDAYEALLGEMREQRDSLVAWFRQWTLPDHEPTGLRVLGHPEDRTILDLPDWLYGEF